MTTAARGVSTAADALTRAHAVLAAVPDPEIPVLSVVDLGIIRAVELGVDGVLRVSVSPTYSGCPASAVIRGDIEQALSANGFDQVVVSEVLSPAWTSDWISEAGRSKLRDYGIAPPPVAVSSVHRVVHRADHADCPRCGSTDTELLSEFGSTPCKALHRCRACLEPFDRFKCI